MDEITVTTEHMKALKALSDIQLKISDARTSLTKLQEDETSYLILREQKAVEKIVAVLEESKGLINESNKNYKGVLELHALVSEFAKNVEKAHISFEMVFEDFKNKSEQKETEIDAKMAEIAEMHKVIKVARVNIEGDKKAIEEEYKVFEQKMVVLKDREGVVDRETRRLVTREAEIRTNLELIKTGEKQVTARQNIILAKEVNIQSKEKNLDERETRIVDKERALADKYATLEKTLKEVSQ